MPSSKILAKLDPSFLNSKDHHFLWKAVESAENYLPSASSNTDAKELVTPVGKFPEDEGKRGLENDKEKTTDPQTDHPHTHKKNKPRDKI